MLGWAGSGGPATEQMRGIQGNMQHRPSKLSSQQKHAATYWPQAAHPRQSHKARLLPTGSKLSPTLTLGSSSCSWPPGACCPATTLTLSPRSQPVPALPQGTPHVRQLRRLLAGRALCCRQGGRQARRGIRQEVHNHHCKRRREGRSGAGGEARTSAASEGQTTARTHCCTGFQTCCSWPIVGRSGLTKS